MNLASNTGLAAPALAVAAALDDPGQIERQAALLYRVRDEVLSQTEEGQRFIDLYEAHSAEIAGIMLSHPDLDQQGLAVIDLFTPNLQALVDGQGGTATITAGQVQSAEAFLNAMLPYASPELAQAIAEEQARRPLEQMAGLTMDQAWENLNQEPTPAPRAPRLIFPPDGLRTYKTRLSFWWHPARFGRTYHLQIDNNADFSSPELDITIGRTRYTTVLPKGRYYWRVQALNSAGTAGPWSHTRTFTIRSRWPRHHGR